MGKLLILILALSLLLITASVSAQVAVGGAYQLTAGLPVGGGGFSSSGAYMMNGSVPLSGAGPSSSGLYIVAGGVLATLSQPTVFNVEYSGTSQALTMAGADLSFSALFSGGSAVDTVGQLFYRAGGQSGYTLRNMARTPGDTTFSYTLNGNILTSRGLEYYINIRVGTDSLLVGDPNSPYIFVCSLSNSFGQCPTAMPAAKYRIVGLPLDPSSSSVNDVFADDMGGGYGQNWRLGNYDPTTNTVLEYPNALTVQPGRGYWLITRGSKTYGTSGMSMLPDTSVGSSQYYRVALDSGWNQVGNPFAFNIDFDSILIDTGGVFVDHDSINNVLDSDSAYYYTDSGYVTTRVIPGWKGFFVETARSGVRLWFRYEESSGPVPKRSLDMQPEINDEYWTVELKVERNGMIDRGNSIGVRPDALYGRDKYDFSEPPPPPDGPRFAFKLPVGPNSLKRSDFRPPLEDGAEWNIDLTNCSGGLLSLDGWDQIPTDMEVWLKFGRNATIKLTANEPIKIPHGFERATLIIANDNYVSGKSGDLMLPLVFNLEQNYPNPFNPTTNIGFSLPTSASTRLEILNILGQKVKTLINGDMNAGFYNVIWPGTDDSDRPVASGIYFYRLQQSEKVSTKKMLLLK